MGSGNICGRVIVWLGTGKQRKTPGEELVGFSRATDSEMMAISKPLHEIDMSGILTIGQGKASNMRRSFKNKMKVTAQRTHIYYTNKSI